MLYSPLTEDPVLFLRTQLENVENLECEFKRSVGTQVVIGGHGRCSEFESRPEDVLTCPTWPMNHAVFPCEALSLLRHNW